MLCLENKTSREQKGTEKMKNLRIASEMNLLVKESESANSEVVDYEVLDKFAHYLKALVEFEIITVEERNLFYTEMEDRIWG